MLAILVLLLPSPALSQTVERNLATCLSGKYPALCRYDLLSPEQRNQASAAESRENLAVCLTGKYPALCNYAKLSVEERRTVKAAERAENLKICLTGKYPALCNRALLDPDERKQVLAAESAENLKMCLDGRYPVLCNRALLTESQRKQSDLAQAASDAKKATPNPGPATARAPRAPCYSASITSPTPFMGNDGEVIKLDDGSLWEVKFAYEYLYEYSPSVVICPSTGKLSFKSKTMTVQRLSPEPSSSKVTPPDEPAPDSFIESRIDGEFSGWEGETIFKLRNGQIWQQSSYAYKYKYAYSPEVVIYKSGTGYKMRVKGVDGEIAVRRLR